KKTAIAYYDAAARASSKFIAERGKIFLGANVAATADIAELSLVMSLLHVQDANWSKREMDDLPGWMHQISYLVLLERFCLTAKRPRTAFEFAKLIPQDSGGQPATAVFEEYLEQSAESRIKSRDYPTAFWCIRTAIAIRSEHKQSDDVQRLRLRLAEV